MRLWGSASYACGNQLFRYITVYVYMERNGGCIDSDIRMADTSLTRSCARVRLSSRWKGWMAVYAFSTSQVLKRSHAFSLYPAILHFFSLLTGWHSSRYTTSPN